MHTLVVKKEKGINNSNREKQRPSFKGAGCTRTAQTEGSIISLGGTRRVGSRQETMWINNKELQVQARDKFVISEDQYHLHPQISLK